MSRTTIKQIFIIFGIIIGIFLLTVLAITSNGEPFCLFKRFFDIPCPGCGISRGVSAIFRGHFIEALRYNLLSYPVVLGAILVVFWNACDLIRSQDTFLKAFHRIKIGRVGFVILLLLTIANWIYNIHVGL